MRLPKLHPELVRHEELGRQSQEAPYLQNLGLSFRYERQNLLRILAFDFSATMGALLLVPVLL